MLEGGILGFDFITRNSYDMRHFFPMRRAFAGLLFFAGLCANALGAPLAVHLRSTLPSPQPVGTAIGLTPRIENVAEGMHVFQYSVRVNSGPFRVVRDFSQRRDFAWTPELFEHDATVRVTVRNNKTKETADDEMRFRVVPRVRGTAPVVTATANPLIALFSSPPCPEGTKFRVAFHPEGEESTQRTPLQPCRGTISNNVYVAGMRADTRYQLRQELVSGDSVKTATGFPSTQLYSTAISHPCRLRYRESAGHLFPIRWWSTALRQPAAAGGRSRQICKAG